MPGSNKSTGLKKKCPAIEKWGCSTIAHPKQQDARSCGVFVYRRTNPPEGESGLPCAPRGGSQVRTARLLEMAVSLSTNSDDLSQVCRACGEKSSGAEFEERIRRGLKTNFDLQH